MIRIRPPVASLEMEAAFDVMAAARAVEAMGREVLHLYIGQPDIPTPPHVVEAGVRALRDGHTGYVAPAGLPALREAVASAAREWGIPAAVENVVVTPGTKPAIFHALHALLEPGDEALVPDPGFPVYPAVVRLLGASPVPYPVRPARSPAVDPDEVAARITPRTRLLALNFPANPTGRVLEEETLARLAELAARHDLAVLSDEVYGRLTFESPHRSIAAVEGMAERTVVVGGVSKAYAMTGWRLGWAIGPPRLADALTALVANDVSCTPPFVQLAGLEALTDPQECVREWVETLRSRRAPVVRRLDGIDGVRCPRPEGAFYVFPEVGGILEAAGLGLQELADRLLEEEGVAVLPGDAFGAGGEGHFRISLSAPLPRLEEALDRIEACFSAVGSAA